MCFQIMLKKKWMGQFERQRQKMGTPKSAKGGRPPKSKDAVDRSPGHRVSAVITGIIYIFKNIRN